MQINKLLNIVLRTNITPVLWGEHGTGKSSVIRQITEAEGIEFVDLRLSQVEAGDLIGMPDRSNGETIWLKPAWWPKDGSKGILFLDELNRAKEDVLQCVFQLVLDRKLYTHTLPDGWKVVAACNPPNGQYFVNELDAALMDRFIHFKFRNTLTDWTEYVSNKADVHPAVISFVNTNPDHLMKDCGEYDLPVLPTPRSWDMLGQILSIMTPVEIKEYSVLIASGLIGTSLAITFDKHSQGLLKKVPSPEELLVEGKLSKFWKESNGSDNGGMLEYAIQNIVYFINTSDKYNAKAAANLCKFVDMVPSDFALKLGKLIVNLSKEKPVVKKYQDYFNINLNPDLMQSLNKLRTSSKSGV